MLGIFIVATILVVFGMVEVIGNCYEPAWYRKWTDLLSGSYERHLLGEQAVRGMGFISGGLAVAIGTALCISAVLQVQVGNVWVGAFALTFALIFAQAIYTSSGATLFPARRRSRFASSFRRRR